MKKLRRIGLLTLLSASLSLTGCFFDFGYLKPEDIEKSQVTLTYKDYVENNIYDIDSTPCEGNPKILVFHIWFTDSNLYIKANEKEQVRSDIEDAYFGSNTDTGWRSVKTYYEELSNNKIHLTGVVTDWYTCSESSRQYYNIKTGQAKTNQLVTTVVDWYREQSGDTTMTSFDSDHNGYLDGVMLIYGSPDYGALYNDNASNMWAYCFWLQTGLRNKNKPNPNAFFWASYDFMYGKESTIGSYHSGDTRFAKIDTHTFIHEMGHMFGLEDYYDYSGKYVPAGGFSMQDYNVGCHDPYSATALGWTNVLAPTDSCVLELKSFQSSREVILLNNRFTGTPFDEYLLLELYTPDGLNEFDSHHMYKSSYPMGASNVGIRLWHVDARLLACLEEDDDMVIKYITNEMTNQYRYTHAMSNTYYLKDADSNAYVTPLGEEYANYNILQLIKNSTYETYKSSSLMANYFLFRTGDKFNIKNYSKQFVGGTKFNNGEGIKWSFEVKSINSDAATIKLEKSII